MLVIEDFRGSVADDIRKWCIGSEGLTRDIRIVSGRTSKAQARSIGHGKIYCTTGENDHLQIIEKIWRTVESCGFSEGVNFWLVLFRKGETHEEDALGPFMAPFNRYDTNAREESEGTNGARLIDSAVKTLGKVYEVSDRRVAALENQTDAMRGELWSNANKSIEKLTDLSLKLINAEKRAAELEIQVKMLQEMSLERLIEACTPMAMSIMQTYQSSMHVEKPSEDAKPQETVIYHFSMAVKCITMNPTILMDDDFFSKLKTNMETLMVQGEAMRQQMKASMGNA